MLTAQGDVYRKLANACIFKSNCLSFETWGYVDGDYSFLSDPMNGFMFDDEYNTKKAYTQVFNKLASANRSNNEVVARLAGEI
jgi:GH35 family endo-1,4-beta-xylanase